MHGVPELLLAAGMATVGLPSGTILGHEEVDGDPFAMVRFVNNTPGLASLAIGGKGVFLGVPTGKVTDYAVVSQKLVSLTLMTISPVSDPVTIDQWIEDGARYTITARIGLHGEATLAVAQEEALVLSRRIEW